VYASERQYALQQCQQQPRTSTLAGRCAIPYGSARNETGSARMKLALWQTLGFPADPPANLAALRSTAQAAAAGGAELLLCPECWLCGYNIGAAVAGLAESSDGVSAQHIAAIARQNNIAIGYGYAERDLGSGHIYNAVQVIGADGATLSHYRKTHLFGADERAAYRPGIQFEPPFRFGAFRVGLLICYDVEYPEAVRSLALMGADVILIPTALTDEYAAVTDFLVPARSIENQVYLAYCNHAGVENGMRFLGGSRLTGMDGKALAAAGAGEALIIGEISKPDQVSAARIYPYHSDRRPELYGRLTRASDRQST
jgi:5-aminopentanamidase